jgi:hypothetical protein
MPHSYGDSLATVGFFLGARIWELRREKPVKRNPSNAKMRIGRYWSTVRFYHATLSLGTSWVIVSGRGWEETSWLRPTMQR